MFCLCWFMHTSFALSSCFIFIWPTCVCTCWSGSATTLISLSSYSFSVGPHMLSFYLVNEIGFVSARANVQISLIPEVTSTLARWPTRRKVRYSHRVPLSGRARVRSRRLIRVVFHGPQMPISLSVGMPMEMYRRQTLVFRRPSTCANSWSQLVG
jgi:hypothetical protein